jgi:cellulase/cellobiase CelA1
VQLWHGTNDTLVPYQLLQESIEQWTNVFGLSQTPTFTDTPQANWNRRRYADGTGAVQVEAYSISGAGHSLPSGGMAAVAVQFFGLASADPTSPPPGPTTPPPGPTTPPPGPAVGCRVGYTANSWSNGFTATVTVTNTGRTAVNGWTLQWTWPGNQQVTNGWNATVTQSGTQVSARNAAWNATIPPNASTSFGFQVSYSGTNSPPTAFTLNGAACAR